MFETLTGSPPFTGDNPIQIILKHLNSHPDRLFEPYRDLNIPESLQNVVLGCLAKEREGRYQSPESLERDLRGVRVGQVIKRPGHSSNKQLIIVASMLVTVSLVAVVILTEIAGKKKSLLETGDPAQTLFERWSLLDIEGQKHFDQGDLNEARRCFESGLKLAEEDSAHAALARESLNELQDLKRALELTGEARQIVSRPKVQDADGSQLGSQAELDLLSLTDERPASNPKEWRQRVDAAVSSAVRYAAISSTEGRYALADRLLSLSENAAKTIFGVSGSAQLIPVLVEQGINDHRQAKERKAAAALSRALNLEEKYLSPNDCMYADTLLELGRVELDDEPGSAAKAQAYLQCALDIYSKTLGQSSMRIAETRLCLARALLQNGDADKARKIARQALATFRGGSGSNKLDEGRCLAVLGEADSDSDQLSIALDFEESVVAKDRRELAKTLRALSTLYKAKTHKPRSAKALEVRRAAIDARYAQLRSN